jgi:hypothetical protein
MDTDIQLMLILTVVLNNALSLILTLIMRFFTKFAIQTVSPSTPLSTCLYVLSQ